MVIFFSTLNAARRTFITPIVIIFLGYLLFTHVENEIAWDMSLYMTYALNILNGNGYVDMDGALVLFRGPAFPFMIALSYWLFGVNALSALGVVKFFCVLNPLLLYYFGKKIFSEKVGLAAAFLVVSSYSICFWSFQFIDAVWPFFVILHMYFLYAGFEQNKKKTFFFVLSGLFLGVAFLTKEVALLFFPMGLLMFGWIKEYRKKTNFFGISISLLVTLIVLLPWMMYLHRHGALSFLWGTGGPVVLGDIITNTLSPTDKEGQFFNVLLNVLTTSKRYLAAFVYFYSGQTNTVTVNFTIAPLFLISWCFVIFHAFRGHKGCKVLVLGLLLFLPIIYFIGNNHWRFGQVLIVMLFSYITVAYSLFALVGWVCKVVKLPVSIAQIGFLAVAFTLVITQVFVQKEKDIGLARFFEKTTFYHLLTKKEYVAPAITGAFVSPYFCRVVEKIKQLSHDQGAILTDSFWASRNLFIQLGGKRRVYAFPMVWCERNQVILGERPEKNDEKPLYVSSNDLPLEPNYRLYFLFKSQIFDLLRTEQINYIILSPTFPSLHRYFSKSENFEPFFQVDQPGNEDKAYYVYHVKQELEDEGPTPTIFSDDVVLTLNKLVSNSPERYQQICDLFLYRLSSLTKYDVSSMLQSVVEIPQYHAEIGDKYYAQGKVSQAIIAYREAVRLAPDSATIVSRLGDLYLKDGQLDRAVDELLMAIKLEPENSAYHYLLGSVYQKTGFLEKAVEQFETAIRLDPEKGVYHRSLGDLYTKNRRWDKAIEQYKVALKLDPENARFHYLLGLAYQDAGFLDEAINQFETGIRLNPENGVSHRFFGDLYTKNKQWDKAIEQYLAALKLEPENSGYHYLLGSVYQQAGSLDKAEEQFETAIRLDPENGWYHRFLGQLYELKGQQKMALEQYQQAVRLDTENASFHYLLGGLYQKMMLPDKALEEYKELIRLSPENIQYQQLVQQFAEDRVSNVK